MLTNWNMGESIYIYQKDLLYGESGKTQALEDPERVWSLPLGDTQLPSGHCLGQLALDIPTRAEGLN